MKLIRVAFGKKDTEPALREYHAEGDRRVGTITEFCKLYPKEKFNIIDSISGDD